MKSFSFIVRNWPQKLLAFAISTVIFFMLRALISNSVTLTIPVKVECGEDAAVEAVFPSTVQVTFRGSAADIRGLDQRDIDVFLQIFPMTADTNGKVRVNLRHRNIRGTRDVQVVDFVPKQVDVQLDHRSTITLPVSTPTLTGKPLRGLATVALSHNAVQVTGSRRALKLLEEEKVQLLTTPIDVEGAPQDFSTRVKVLPPPNVVVHSITPLTLLATVTITTTNIFREIPLVPVRVVQPVAGKRLIPTPSLVTVKLTGRGDIIGNLTSESVAVFAEQDQTNTLIRIWTPPDKKFEHAEVIPSQILLSPEASHE